MEYSTEFIPVIRQHIYWQDKADFQMEVDRYSDWVIFAVEKGKFSYRIGLEEGEASFGDWVVCPPNTDFHRKVISPLSFHFIIVQQDPGFPGGKISFQDSSRLHSTYRHLRLLKNPGLSTHANWCSHLLHDLWLLYQWEKVELTLFNNTIIDDPLMEEASILIQEKAFDSMAMADIAQQLGLSPVQLTRRFRHTWGLTPSDYLAALRMENAQKLLANSTLTLDEIARKCGYENGFYLSRVFKRTSGMSPKRYRQTHRV